MMYDFIAAFYGSEEDETPRYRTHLFGNDLSEPIIRKIGMNVDPDSTPGYLDYIKEISIEDMSEFFPLQKNPELASIIFEGEPCGKIVLHAYESDPGSMICCRFGTEEKIMATFTGNQPASRVRISGLDSPAVVDLPLNCFKERMHVLTLFEVMERLKQDYKNLAVDDLAALEERFAK